MSNEISKYLEKFRSHLRDREQWWSLLRQARRAGNKMLEEIASGVGDSEEDQEKKKETFLKLLKIGDFAEAMAIAEPSLAAFDKIGTPESEKLKVAGRKALESEFALWHAHKLLLDWMLADPSRGSELDKSEDFRELISDRVAFSLHEELCFAEIWREVFPEQAGH